MAEAIGKRNWVIAEGYIPSDSHPKEHQYASHETACILNAGERPANLVFTIFFSDRDPVGPYNVTIDPQRTKHIRLSDFNNPEIPKETDYSTLIKSDVPIVVQHTRLDSRRSDLALMTTLAFSGSG